jgi:hypothetical protein
MPLRAKAPASSTRKSVSVRVRTSFPTEHVIGTGLRRDAGRDVDRTAEVVALLAIIGPAGATAG